APDLGHPSAEQLAAFGVGRLDDDDSAVIETHLGNCDRCRTVVEQLPNDTLLSLVRQLPAPVATEATTRPREAPEENPPGEMPMCVTPDGAATLAESSDAPAAALGLPVELADHTRYHVLELLG